MYINLKVEQALPKLNRKETYNSRDEGQVLGGLLEPRK
jgi:hypothetical protein